MTRVAAIDCGTNSIRLLIADVTEHGLVDLDRRMLIVRLGQDVDRTGRLAPEALQRTFAACDEYAAAIATYDVEQVRFVATSASRDAENRDEFIDGVRARFNVEPTVVPGSEEAALSFMGATRGLMGAVAPYLVVDIGGGSTEFVLGTTSPGASLSVDIGCVRMTERHLHDDPPTAQQIAAATADIDAAIDRAAAVVPFNQATTLIGLAGSVTTIAAVALGQQTYDPTAIHGARLSAATVSQTSDRLLAMTRAQRAAVSVIHPGRVDVINAGALVLRRIMDATNMSEVLVSEHDILDGIAWSMLGNIDST